jgi:Tat protein translocase TatB subunit
MFDSGELLLIALVAFLVFGPKRLPELARMLGKFVYEIREGMRNATVEMKKEFNEIEKAGKEDIGPPRKEDVPGEEVPGKDAAAPAEPKDPDKL